MPAVHADTITSVPKLVADTNGPVSLSVVLNGTADEQNYRVFQFVQFAQSHQIKLEIRGSEEAFKAAKLVPETVVDGVALRLGAAQEPGGFTMFFGPSDK
ncbi:hypothetical protein ABNQ39_07050 [Azospirillum sp. A26]|uniref:hypothetical protein n=1 Tax=Azospirillum sp. A26 TaxID=3160607 RepID=UPI00366D32F1